MNDSLEALQGEVLDRIQRSDSEKELEQIRVETLGRSGSLTLLLRGMKDLPAEEAGRSLLREVDLFLGDQRLDDDLSLVVLLRQGGIG